jgi:hypothetical protein
LKFLIHILCITCGVTMCIFSFKVFYTWRTRSTFIFGLLSWIKLCNTSVNPVHNAPVDPPHPVLRISHSSSLPPIKTPRTPPPPPPPLHGKNKNHDPPKPLAQKKRTQISSPTSSKSQKYLPHRRRQLLCGNEHKNKSKNSRS